MPFRSKSQMRYLFAKEPKIAKRWAKEGYTGKGLPEKVGKKKSHGISNLKRRK